MADAFITSEVTADTCRRRMLMESWLASAALTARVSLFTMLTRKSLLKSVKV